jgi:hypothetical protein
MGRSGLLVPNEKLILQSLMKSLYYYNLNNIEVKLFVILNVIPIPVYQYIYTGILIICEFMIMLDCFCVLRSILRTIKI